MFDVPSGLAQSGSNFIKRIALYKEEAKGLTLVLRQCFKHLLKASVSQPSLNRVLKPWICCSRIGEVACFLGLLTGTLGKISMDVKLLMQTEVAEVYEPFHEARGSSSTMPQKRNPISCLYIHSTVALVRQHVAALLEAAVADHERSTGPWEIEWISLPEIFLLASGALAQTKLLVCGLEVDADRMRANLDLTRGMIVSEAVMMGLGPHLGRQRAHDLVYDICRKVSATGVPLVELLAQNADISKHLTRAELDKMCDPAAYLGLAGEMVDKVLAREPRSAG